MKVLILAAGRGLRLRPLTLDMPKHLIEVAGKPFLYHVLKNLKDAGLENIGMVVGYKKEMVENFLKKYGIRVKLIDQKEQLGTGHAVLSAEKWIGDENFIVLMGDGLYSPKDLKSINKNDEYCYIAGIESETPEKFGVLVEKSDLLIRIAEKPKEFAGNLVNTGLYKFTPDIFQALKAVRTSERGEIELTDAVSKLAEKAKVRVVRIKDYWLELGSLKDISKISRFLARKK
jgi:dTDP-glucose pyrophosphorylase